MGMILMYSYRTAVVVLALVIFLSDNFNRKEVPAPR